MFRVKLMCTLLELVRFANKQAIAKPLACLLTKKSKTESFKMACQGKQASRERPSCLSCLGCLEGLKYRPVAQAKPNWANFVIHILYYRKLARRGNYCIHLKKIVAEVPLHRKLARRYIVRVRHYINTCQDSIYLYCTQDIKRLTSYQALDKQARFKASNRLACLLASLLLYVSYTTPWWIVFD